MQDRLQSKGIVTSSDVNMTCEVKLVEIVGVMCKMVQKNGSPRTNL